jgi:hypothetical protein
MFMLHGRELPPPMYRPPLCTARLPPSLHRGRANPVPALAHAYLTLTHLQVTSARTYFTFAREHLTLTHLQVTSVRAYLTLTRTPLTFAGEHLTTASACLTLPLLQVALPFLQVTSVHEHLTTAGACLTFACARLSPVIATARYEAGSNPCVVLLWIASFLAMTAVHINLFILRFSIWFG